MTRAEATKEIIAVLEDANEMCRSCHSVADRDGLQTNWKALRTQLDAAVNRQQKCLNYVVPILLANERDEVS